MTNLKSTLALLAAVLAGLLTAIAPDAEALLKAVAGSSGGSSYNPAAVAITGGTIDGTVIGGGTPAAGTFTPLTANSSFTATGLVTLADIVTVATNTVLGNATSGTASPSALTVGSCSTSASALNWTTNTGFGCNTAVNAAQLGGATFAAPGAIGGTTPAAITGTNLNVTGNTLPANGLSLNQGANDLTLSANSTVVFDCISTACGADSQFSLSTPSRTSGVNPYFTINQPADTGITASTTGPGLQTVTAIRTWATTGTVANQYEYHFVAPTYASANASQTFTVASTFDIQKPPIQGTNAIFTLPLALNVEAGPSEFGGTAYTFPTNPATTVGSNITVPATTTTYQTSPPALASAIYVGQPTFADAAATQTITTGATLYIANAPANGTNITITNPYALDVAAGASIFGGAVTMSPANANIAISPTGTGTVAISPAGALTINPTASSTINNTTIGITTSASAKFTQINWNANFQVNGKVAISATAPTIASGFGTSPSVTANNGTAAFTINVGTGGSASSGVVTMPAASTGWSCTVEPNGAPQAAAITYSAPTSTTSITITNYTLTTGAALAWTASLVLDVNCVGF